MEYLKKLFNTLDTIGWGDSREYNGTVEDIKEAHNILTGDGHLSIVAMRANHLREYGDNPINFKKWLEQVKENEGDTFLGYMLRKYPFINRDFVLHITLDELNELAKVRLSYGK